MPERFGCLRRAGDSPAWAGPTRGTAGEVLQRVSFLLLLLLLPAPPNICKLRRQQQSRAAAMPSRQLLLACRHPARQDPGHGRKEASSSRSWCLLLPSAAEAAAREEQCSCSVGIRAQICLLQGLFLGRRELVRILRLLAPKGRCKPSTAPSLLLSARRVTAHSSTHTVWTTAAVQE